QVGLPAFERKLKGLARAVRVPLFRVRDYEVISPELESFIFRRADILSEGRLEGGQYAGSTMITVDLSAAGTSFRESATEDTLDRVAEAARHSVRIHTRALRIARTEASRRCSGVALGTMTANVGVQI